MSWPTPQMGVAQDEGGQPWPIMGSMGSSVGPEAISGQSQSPAGVDTPSLAVQREPMGGQQGQPEGPRRMPVLGP